ncbi:BspA family leucine-rich repeat surface protein [Enterococcus faecalis]|uniref:BspA family leucine-rich repeat surface protein n=1 Tax=Enterococcus faecalis TaxID=1351 RepID=UPI0021C865B1|nr:BspA family leucine-rich repeat surface protein [Enterococcus faecalis]
MVKKILLFLIMTILLLSFDTSYAQAVKNSSMKTSSSDSSANSEQDATKKKSSSSTTEELSEFPANYNQTVVSSTEQTIINEETDTLDSTKSIVKGIWGTCPWSFNNINGELIIESGVLGDSQKSPWMNNPSGADIDKLSIKVITLKASVKASSDSSNLFAGLNNVTTFNGLNNLDTTEITDMSGMFSAMHNVTQLDLSNFNTSKVTNMSRMVSYTRKVKSLDLSNLDTHLVTDMSSMFKGTGVTELNVNNLDTHLVTDMSSMFADLDIQTLDLSNLDTHSVTNMSSMFADLDIQTLDLSNLDTHSVTNMRYMFLRTKVSELNLNTFDTNNVADMYGMFSSSEINNLDISSFNTNKVKVMDVMFNKSKLEKITLGNNFKFLDNTFFPRPSSIRENNTGKWIKENEGTIAYLPIDFTKLYGTGDLTSGTYIAEKKQLSINLVSPVYKKIGDEFTTDFELQLNPYDTVKETDKGTELLVTYDLPMDGLVEPESKIDISLFDLNNSRIDSVVCPISKSGKKIQVKITLSSDQLNITRLVKFSLKGKVWNNTAWRSTATTEVEYPAWGGSIDENRNLKTSVESIFEVKNGTLEIKDIPDSLNYKKGVLSDIKNGSFINLENTTNFIVNISDYRGTNIVSAPDASSVRRDWELIAMATKFKDKNDQEISSDILSLAYVENGTVTDLSDTEEVLIHHHSVDKETPEINHIHKLTWNDNDGIKVHVKNKSKLEDQRYKTTITFELRQAP